jgi:alanyl-tRNA synthetase
MGLERLLAIVQGKRSVFECDLFEPWLSTLLGLWQPDQRSLRLVTDHLRSAIVVIRDGVQPASNGRGYVLRRLIRRTLSTLWRDDNSRTLSDLPTALFEHTLTHFGQETTSGVTAGCASVRRVLQQEERRFHELLTRGRKVMARMSPGQPLTEEDYRYLHETHGLPRELVTDLLPKLP